MLVRILNTTVPESIDEKIKFLLSHHIAIYDAAVSCEIEGSSDAKMSKIAPVNLKPLFKEANIKQVYANGGKAYEICKKYLEGEIIKAIKNEVIKLPSTSPANAKFSLERLTNEWKVIVKNSKIQI